MGGNSSGSSSSSSSSSSTNYVNKHIKLSCNNIVSATCFDGRHRSEI